MNPTFWGRFHVWLLSKFYKEECGRLTSMFSSILCLLLCLGNCSARDPCIFHLLAFSCFTPFCAWTAEDNVYWLIYFAVPGVIGCLQALEAIKIASGIGEPLSGRMVLFDALSARIRIVCFIFHMFEVSLPWLSFKYTQLSSWFILLFALLRSKLEAGHYNVKFVEKMQH